MSNKRQQYSPQFKAKVALEAIRGEKTLSEI
jgi:transposase-like protein